MMSMQLESNHTHTKLATHNFVPVVSALFALQAVAPASHGRSAIATLNMKSLLVHPPQTGFVLQRCARALVVQMLKVLLALRMDKRNAPAAVTAAT